MGSLREIAVRTGHTVRHLLPISILTIGLVINIISYSTTYWMQTGKISNLAADDWPTGTGVAMRFGLFEMCVAVFTGDNETEVCNFVFVSEYVKIMIGLTTLGLVISAGILCIVIYLHWKCGLKGFTPPLLIRNGFMSIMAGMCLMVAIVMYVYKYEDFVNNVYTFPGDPVLRDVLSTVQSHLKLGWSFYLLLCPLVLYMASSCSIISVSRRPQNEINQALVTNIAV